MRHVGILALSALLCPWALRAEVPVEVVDRAEVRLVVDGLIRDWGADFAEVSARGDVVSGVERWQGPDDARFRFALARDGEWLWLAAEVTDDRLVRSRAHGEGDDALVLTLAVESGGVTAVREVLVLPGEPGQFAGAVRWSTGGRGDVLGAQVVEAPSARGLTLEARIPWRAMPDVRAGIDTLRARVAWRDADSPGRSSPESVLATGPGSARAPGEIPRVVNARIVAPAAPADPIAQFRAERGLTGVAATFDRAADLGGDARTERVVVLPGFVVVAGPAVSEGRGYQFVELPSRAAQDLVEVGARDVTGDGKAEVVIRQRVVVGELAREFVSVYALDAAGALGRVFAQEVSRAEGASRLSDTLTWSAGGRARVAFDRNEGWTRERWAAAAERGVEEPLTPWGADRARSYVWSAATRSFGLERSEPNPVAPVAPAPGAAAAPADPAADVQGVLALFRQRENLPADARPTHRATGDVVEDPTPEQLYVFDRTLVVVGPRFLGGRSYYAMGLPIVSGDEVLSLAIADLTGDGRGEAVVRVRRNVTSQVRGAQVPSQREMVFAYCVDPAHRGRVFAAEVARRVGDDAIENRIALPRAGSAEVVVEAGAARGWTAESYPFRDAPQTQYFPLLLPWDAGSRRVTYRWTGSAFSRSP